MCVRNNRAREFGHVRRIHSAGASPSGHSRGGIVVRVVRHTSTSLHPFAPPALPGFVATMDALTPERPALRTRVSRRATSRAGVTAHEHRPVPLRSPCFMIRFFQPFRLQPPFVVPGSDCFCPGLTACCLVHPVCRERAASWASPLTSWLATTIGRIEFVSYGLAVHLPLLSTPPRGDAVTVRYEIQSKLRRGLAPR